MIRLYGEKSKLHFNFSAFSLELISHIVPLLITEYKDTGFLERVQLELHADYGDKS